MEGLYPLKFKPIFKDKIWGGDRIRSVMGLDFSPLPNCGEAWMLSGVAGNPSVVSNGFLAGNELNELLEVYMYDLVGDEVYEKFGNEFPVLIKLIDANDWLSIQVHPDDELAAKRNIGRGKTEMWYIMDAEPGSELIIGFNRDVSREACQEALASGKLLELLHYEPVRKGDAFFINSGKIHAIGGGILLAEIQQSSDVTYRVYDFDRKDAEGNPRELHTDLALDAMDYARRDDFRIAYPSEKNTAAPLVDSAYFKTSCLHLDSPLMCEFKSQGSFRVYVCVDGSATLELGSYSVPIEKGETALLPAAAPELRIQTWGCRLLEVTL